jgi:hypothetical protein
MSESVRKVFAALVLFAIPIVLLSAVNAQTAAKCTFHLFKTPGTPAGVNDYGTVVGMAQTYTPSTGFIRKGFIRYSNGTVSYFQAPNTQTTFFTARNNAGVTVGGYSIPSQVTPVPGAGLILNGSKFTSVKYPNAVNTGLFGINKYNTTVGVAGGSKYQSYAFKRYSNGSLVTLQYPGAQDTWPRAINDHGTIVGTAGGQGFIYHGGTWAKVAFPNSGGGGSINGTQLFGISNNNVIVGQAGSSPPTSFLYANGVFKIILAPNSGNTQVEGISADGLITGIAYINGVNAGSGFLATCQ